MKRRDLLAFASLLLANSAQNPKARAQAPLDPMSPNAIALGYAENHTQVDGLRWPKKAGDRQGVQRCDTCALYTESDSSCSIFGGQTVSANGWCNAWTKR